MASSDERRTLQLSYQWRRRIRTFEMADRSLPQRYASCRRMTIPDGGIRTEHRDGP